MNDNAQTVVDAIDIPQPEDWASVELWRLLVGVLKTVGGRVSVSRDLIAALDKDKDDLRIIAGTDTLTIQTGNGLGP